jgi:hypothetical protein
MTHYFATIVEQESNGTWSAWVPGLSVYAAADTRAKVKSAIRSALAAHLVKCEDIPKPNVDVLVLRSDTSINRARMAIKYVGLGAMMARRSSPAKTAAARLNGLKGGRPALAARHR